jgi:hypothetical protein
MLDLIEARSGTFFKGKKICSTLLKTAQNLLNFAQKQFNFAQNEKKCSKLLKTVKTCLQLKRVMMSVKDVCMLFFCVGSQSSGDRLPRWNPFFFRQVFVGASGGTDQFWRNRIII